MSHTSLIALCLQCACSMLPGKPTIELTPGEGPHQEPFRSTNLSITNDTQQIVRAVGVRLAQGGPEYVFGFVISPGESLDASIDLPVMTAQQAYQVRLMSGDDPNADCIHQQVIETSWPAELTTPGVFVDGLLWRRFESDQPSWPSSTKRNLILALAVLCIGVITCFLICRTTLRLAAIAALSTIWAVVAIPAISTPILHEHHARLEAVPQGISPHVLIIGSLRTVRHSTQATNLLPVYLSERAMQAEDMVVHMRTGSSFTVTPGWPRVFRQANDQGDYSSSGAGG